MLPVIIQGGMGAGISGFMLAAAVASRGHLGVVSGTAMDTILVRRLNDGDPGGYYRRALAAYPMQEYVEEVLGRFFRPEGREGAPYTPLKMFSMKLDLDRARLLALGSFAEVFLAKEGHDGVVGINLLTKIQFPNLPSLYGAMLAGVNYVLMGAGIPRDIPESLDRMAQHEPASMHIDVQGANGGDDEILRFNPREIWDRDPIQVARPAFLPIVASNSLATMMARKASGSIEGFIVEGPTAGGHNAPPRGPRQFNERGEPLYGERDVVDLQKLAELGLPFWVAGGAGRPGRLEEVRAQGAAGVQVGTLFAYSDESGLRADLKARVIHAALAGKVDVYTDDRASPTGFPFKVVTLGDTLSDAGVYEKRQRVCDLGYLRTPYRREDGKIRFRCASEPVDTFLKKGGSLEETVGRKCLCNGLVATIGAGQVRDNEAGEESPILTSGDDLVILDRFLRGRTHYTAADVLDYLLGAPAGAASGSAHSLAEMPISVL
ncbi:MAG: nitronate monooxygenase [Longimicrobiales bacterium]|nr:nitronate monooxygenase [Longimicrobiales bacterium]